MPCNAAKKQEKRVCYTRRQQEEGAQHATERPHGKHQGQSGGRGREGKTQARTFIVVSMGGVGERAGRLPLLHHQHQKSEIVQFIIGEGNTGVNSRNKNKMGGGIVALSVKAHVKGCNGFSSVHSVVSNSLRPHGLQYTRLPCPSLNPGACSNSCPSSQLCPPAISSSVIPFSSCLQSFPASGSFQMSQFFTSGGQSIGASASTSVLPMNSQD